MVCNVSVCGCLSLYVSPAMNWRLIQGVPSVAQCQLPMTLKRVSSDR